MKKIDSLHKQHSIAYACVVVGISASTYYEWKRRQENQK